MRPPSQRTLHRREGRPGIPSSEARTEDKLEQEATEFVEQTSNGRSESNQSEIINLIVYKPNEIAPTHAAMRPDRRPPVLERYGLLCRAIR